MGLINYEIEIEAEPKDEERAIHLNGNSSHMVKEPELQALLKEARSNLWKTSVQSGRDIGSQLYQMINSSSGVLDGGIKLAHDEGKTLSLSMILPEDLCGLPFELFLEAEFGRKVQPFYHLGEGRA